MSYNKLKALAANVEAIETAMKIRVQGRQATAQEKEILSLYSGFGGIKEVLNIGTDKPVGGDMEEPIQRLQELIDAYPHFTEPMRHNVMESIKASVLTAFYTPKRIGGSAVIDKGITAEKRACAGQTGERTGGTLQFRHQQEHSHPHEASRH